MADASEPTWRQEFWNNTKQYFKENFPFKEILFFTVMMTLLILGVRLFHYTYVRKRVKEDSRCLRNKRMSSGNSYVVKAVTATNDPMYKITYNLGAKQYLLECDCEGGDVVNEFSNIKVYDMRDPYKKERTIKKFCWCKNDISTGQNAYYTGHPPLVRFMKEGDTSFFSTV